MARETFTQLVDDLDGTIADTTVRFGLDGREYTIDLTAEHEHEFRTALAPFLEVAVKVRPTASIRGRGQLVPDKDRNASIREWALSEGVQLAQRGRIANVVQDAYDARDGNMLRESLGLELIEEKPARRRRAATADFSDTD